MKVHNYTRHITPERAQQILLENGVKVSLSKAALVLDFMYKCAILEVENYRDNES
jgi:hypothetical protein